MRRYKVEVGNSNNIKPGNILGAIANEADMDSAFIGSIQIFDNFSTVDLPDDMPKETFEVLKKTMVNGKSLSITELTDKNNKATIGGGASQGARNFGRKKFSKDSRNDSRGTKGGRRRDSKGRDDRKPKFSRSKPKNKS